MILEHDGQTVDFFDKFPEDINNIGIYLSGGTDSALILYLLIKMADDRGQKLNIYPINGYDVTTPQCDSEIPARAVLNYIKNITGTTRIADLMVYPYIHLDKPKYYYLKPVKQYLSLKKNVNHIIFGTSQGMPDLERPVFHENSAVGEELIHISETRNDIMVPWAKVNKKFIAAQYDKFNLKKLSNITGSCVMNGSSPCKECWWCKERYWAFGSYDGGIQ